MKVFVTCMTWLAICALSAAIGGCGGAGADEADAASGSDSGTITIVTTIRPLALIVSEVLEPALGERIDVRSVVAPEVSPHGFEPTPSQIARLRRADVIVYNGYGLDDWARREAPRATRVIRFADVADLDHGHHHHDHDGDHHDCDHHHGPVDEHFWLDQELVAAFAARCVGDLSVLVRERFEDSEPLIAAMHESLAQFAARVNELDAAFASALAPYQGRRIVTHHNVFSRITSRYGLESPLVLRPLAIVEPTPGDLRRAIDLINRESIGAIFIEPQFSARAVEQIRAQTGARLVRVDPLGTEAESWTGLLEAILQALDEGLRASPDAGES